jgi:glycine cleavage system aminomethyltransferase T
VSAARFGGPPDASRHDGDLTSPQVMEHRARQSVVVSVPKTCLAACAAVHDRDGYTVIAHYGSVPGEIAVCMKSVGLADHCDYGVLELHGDRETLDRALIARFGDPPLAVGNARRLHDVWYARMDAHHTMLVGPHAALRAEAATEYGRDRGLPCRDIRASLAIVGIVGPRATRLLTAAGLPGKLAVGAIGTPAGDRSIVAILRESQRRYLALLRADGADDVWARLLSAGEPLGAAFVGYDALTLLNASSSRGG